MLKTELAFITNATATNVS